MYKVNDTVLYGTNGVCRISAIERHSFNSDPSDYYILNPVYDSSSTIFVPLDNSTLCGRMRPVMTGEEVSMLIRSFPETESEWIEDDNRRRSAYNEILQNGEPEKMASVLKTLHNRREALRQKKKRLHITDEKLFNDAERMLHEEIAYVLGIKVDEVDGYIAGELGKLAQ